MKLNIYYGTHPEDVKYYTTEKLRGEFLLQNLFPADEVVLNYSHNDRIIAGGLMPVKKTLILEGGKEIGADTFFERREGGMINIAKGDAIVTLDGTDYTLSFQDCLYIGRGVKEIGIKAKDAANPPKLYFNSTPAHHSYPSKLITLADANKIHLGSLEQSNKRTINQYIVPGFCDSCQLTMGMTLLDECNMWNTMPCHTHERRMEVYFYFDMAENTRVFHLMGKPNETRHIVMANEEAVISPSWSIHSGVGTSRYSFIWGMCGENQVFTDMDVCEMGDVR
ncbi:MAG: 5-dehydro-4-deoxy-D-glucuronate isomerase [Defluviitaleaceae bacterium]|nr:5-dehydro-4-deoxy-D-glucuronate isomerase [Defluviitaleaceae bacterium]MCL2274761.1 5-dehydro-4-deoxy-D-glucuronate isomerase [Defluviitaleaceae bacterium]